MNDPSQPSDKKDVVVTPGGPRPRDQFHQVEHGQAVRGEDKSASTPAQAKVTKPTTEPPRFAMRNARRRIEAPSDDLIITPGGPRPREFVHFVEPGQRLHVDRNEIRMLHPNTQEVGKVIEIKDRRGAVPALKTGWISDAGWWNTTGSPISSFRTTWVVPPAPASQGSQIIFLFNGIQPADGSAILQPVLQWGAAANGGGPFWSIASWYVQLNGNAFATVPAIRVNVGDVLTGVMTLTGVLGTMFSYTCEFQGNTRTRLPVFNIPELVWCNETLEAYNVNDCSDYPYADLTSFTRIDIQTSGGRPATINWTVQDRVTDCCQHTVVVNAANPGGQVDIHYHCAPTVVTSLTRFPDHIDLFTCDPAGAVESTFWDVSNGWFGQYFRLGDSSFWDNFTVPPQTAIAALCRFREHIDLFATGRNGFIYSTYWDESSGWFNHWFRLGDTNFPDGFTVEPGSPIGALSRYQDHIDLFVTGRDGAIFSTFWDASSGWFNRWFRLGDSNFSDGFTIRPASPISSLARYSTHIDLFVAGRDGGIYSTFWDASSGWSNQWFRLSDPNFWDGFTVEPGSPVTALSRFPDHIDLFVAGRDGAIYSTFWDVSNRWFNHWFRLGDTNFPDGFTVEPGSPITALCRYRDHIDLFVTGRDGAIYSTFWDASSGWSNQWFRIGDANFADNFTVPTKSSISAMARNRDHIDLFVCGRDNAVYSTFWDVSSGWFSHWFRP